MIYGIKKDWLEIRIVFHIFLLAVKYYQNLSVAGKVVKQMLKNRANIYGNPKILRYAKVDGKYYWTSDVPGWPSEAYNKYIRSELIRKKPIKAEKRPLQTIIFSITNKCPLRCKHCFEFDNLGTTEKLSLTDLNTILSGFIDKGLFHVQLSGGEPLARFDDLLSIIYPYKNLVSFWILTSGFGLTYEKAQLMKNAGLVGAHISLDHWDENWHNNFRNNDQSFEWVRIAVINCKKAKIVTSLSLCATKEFASEENLWLYLEMAKQWGVDFIRILEPRNTGRYKNEDVELPISAIHMLENFYLELANNKRYDSYPIIDYPGFHQRRSGCFGAGNRYLFIDSNGNYHACPFCQKSHGSALKTGIIDAIISMQDEGCHKFENCNI